MPKIISVHREIKSNLDWQDWLTPPELNFSGNASTTLAKYKRIGDTLVGQIEITLNSTPSNSSAFALSLPVGFTVDDTKVGNTDNRGISFGNFQVEGLATSRVQGIINYNSPNAFRFMYYQESGSLIQLVDLFSNSISGMGNGDKFLINISYPVDGWSIDDLV